MRVCATALWAGLGVALAMPSVTLAAASEQFHEALTIRPLASGEVVSTFSFRTLMQGTPRDPSHVGSDDYPQHFNIFPLSLGQILREYAVTELHLTMNSGSWNYDRWGYPEEPGVGTGAELWMWMGNNASDSSSVDYRWKGARNALAGLFCASLNSLDSQRTTSPACAFSPEGFLPNWTYGHQLRHAYLPSERVCTENLTPFLKLLPCKSLSGIAKLLNPHRLFDATWHGLGVHVQWHPKEGVEVRLTFQIVSDPVRSSFLHQRDWSLQSLFDRTIDKRCPISSSSRVLVALPADATFSLRPESSATAGGQAIFDVSSGTENLDIAMTWPQEFHFEYSLRPYNVPLVPISVRRTLKGSTQDRGQLAVVVTSNVHTEMQVLYLEMMPWLLPFYLHTLQVRLNGSPRNDLLSNMTYTAPVAHSRPTVFHSILRLPPKSTVDLTIDVTKSFLRYTEHPPDAQRGWDLPPAVLVPLDPDASLRDNRPSRLYTPALLVDLATPDFSMPYNVIIFSCSLMAFIFGSVFNLLTRRFVVVSVDIPDTAMKKG